MAKEERKPRGRDTIDANLKRVYQDALDEEVPDRFQSLLEQLKAQDASKADRGGSNSK